MAGCVWLEVVVGVSGGAWFEMVVGVAGYEVVAGFEKWLHLSLIGWIRDLE